MKAAIRLISHIIRIRKLVRLDGLQVPLRLLEGFNGLEKIAVAHFALRVEFLGLQVCWVRSVRQDPVEKMVEMVQLDLQVCSRLPVL